MNVGEQITASDINTLRNKINTEISRRHLTDPIGGTITIVNAGGIISNTTANQILEPLTNLKAFPPSSLSDVYYNTPSSANVKVNLKDLSGVQIKDLSSLNNLITQASQVDQHDNTDCRGSCAGLCTGCQGNSSGGCTDCTGGCSGCSGTCEGGCSGNCTGTCESGCTGTCKGDCTGDCSSGCSGCTGTCEGGCGNNCTGTCEGSCWSCTGSCSGTCTGCTGSCSGSCSGNCYVNCGYDCSYGGTYH